VLAENQSETIHERASKISVAQPLWFAPSISGP
jgi:hypothetical protein